MIWIFLFNEDQHFFVLLKSIHSQTNSYTNSYAQRVHTYTGNQQARARAQLNRIVRQNDGGNKRLRRAATKNKNMTEKYYLFGVSKHKMH